MKGIFSVTDPPQTETQRRHSSLFSFLGECLRHNGSRSRWAQWITVSIFLMQALAALTDTSHRRRQRYGRLRGFCRQAVSHERSQPLQDSAESLPTSDEQHSTRSSRRFRLTRRFSGIALVLAVIAVWGGTAYALFIPSVGATNSVGVGSIATTLSIPNLSGTLYPGSWSAASITIPDNGTLSADEVTLSMSTSVSAAQGSSGLLWWGFACVGSGASITASSSGSSYSCSGTWVPIGASAPSCFGSAMTPAGCLSGSSGWMEDWQSAPWESPASAAPQESGQSASLTAQQASADGATLPTSSTGASVLIPANGGLPVLIVEMLAPNSPSNAQGATVNPTWQVALMQRTGMLRS